MQKQRKFNGTLKEKNPDLKDRIAYPASVTIDIQQELEQIEGPFAKGILKQLSQYRGLTRKQWRSVNKMVSVDLAKKIPIGHTRPIQFPIPYGQRFVGY